MKQYYTQHITANATDQQIESKCSGIMFVNSGATVVIINGHPLQPGDTIVPAYSYPGEIDTTTYSLAWPSGTGTLEVWRKFYR